MQHAPDYTATLGPRVSTGMTNTGEYALSSSLLLHIEDLHGPSGTQFLQPAYTTLDVRAQWTHPSKKYYVAVFGTNVTNDRYRNQVQYNSLASARSGARPRFGVLSLARNSETAEAGYGPLNLGRPSVLSRVRRARQLLPSYN